MKAIMCSLLESDMCLVSYNSYQDVETGARPAHPPHTLVSKPILSYVFTRQLHGLPCQLKYHDAAVRPTASASSSRKALSDKSIE
jgi:hypothetical protein